MDKTKHQIAMRPVAWLAMLLGLLMLQTPVYALVQVKDLYDFELSVKNQGPAERQRVMQDALSKMIARLGGPRATQQFGRTSAAMKKASKYVQQYRYRRSQGQNDTQLKLWMRFNANAVQGLLREKQLPLLGATRAQTLIWIAVEDSRGRSIISTDKRNRYTRTITRHARLIAVPVLLPLMDVQDRRKVRIGDIWGGFATSVKAGSARYQPDKILTAKVYKDVDGWRAQWRLAGAAVDQSWSSSGRNAQQAIKAGLDGLADRLVRSAVSGTQRASGSDYQVSISAVNNLRDYAHSQDYLTGVSVITAAHLHSLSQGRVVFKVQLRGSLDELERALSLQRGLIADQAPPVDLEKVFGRTPGQTGPTLQASPATLYYRLVK